MHFKIAGTTEKCGAKKKTKQKRAKKINRQKKVHPNCALFFSTRQFAGMIHLESKR